MNIPPNPIEQAPTVFTPEQEESLYRRLIWRLVPFLFIFYVSDFLDRVNINFAKLEMLNALKWSETVYGLGGGIFFVGYFVFQIPGNIILEKVGARRWLAAIMAGWGLVSAATMFATTPASFYTIRFLLGVTEAGFFPGVILYLTFWFPKKRRGEVTALFVAAVGFSQIIGGPLSGFIMGTMGGLCGLAGWKWLLIIEGVPSLFLAALAWFYLDDTPRLAKWLTNAEKDLLEGNLARESQSGAKDSAWKVATQMEVWLLSLVVFCLMIGLYAIGFYLPQIIKNSGVTNIGQLGILSAIPYTFAMVAMVWAAKSSDRRNERRWHITVPAFTGALGMALCGLYGHNTLVVIVALTLACAGILTSVPISQTLPMEFLSPAGMAAGIGLINSLSNLGGFASPYMIAFIKDHMHSNAYGLYGVAAWLVLGGILVHTLPHSKKQ